MLGGLWKAGKSRIFGGRRDDDPVTKVKLFLLQILQGNTKALHNPFGQPTGKVKECGIPQQGKREVIYPFSNRYIFSTE